MRQKHIEKDSIKGDISVVEKAVDLSVFKIEFFDKPLIIGGLAMEYYGIRKRGEDIDFIVSDNDYKALAQKYPNHRKDKWGDLFVSLHKYEFLRSIFRLDYDFFSQGAVDCKDYKIISPEKLFFMKVLAYENQPEIEKHKRDYKRMWEFLLNACQNKVYVAEAMIHEDAYIRATDGTIYSGEYPVFEKPNG